MDGLADLHHFAAEHVRTPAPGAPKAHGVDAVTHDQFARAQALECEAIDFIPRKSVTLAIGNPLHCLNTLGLERFDFQRKVEIA